jgi:hypothetical protein
MADEKFLAVVRSQAEARVELDFATFAGYFLPEAVAGIRAAMGTGRSGAPRPPQLGGARIDRFEVLEAESDGETGRSTVRYSGEGSFVLKQGWRRVNDAWRVVSIERPPELVIGPTLLQRIKALPRSFATPRMSRPPGGMMRRF